LPGWEKAGIRGDEDLDLSAYDEVILSSGVYGGCPHKNLLRFIASLKPGRSPKQVRVLLSWLGRAHSNRTTFRHIQPVCAEKGISVSPDFHTSLGHSFGILWPMRPNKKDLAAAVAWAQKDAPR
jgi:hypothetical protein